MHCLHCSRQGIQFWQISPLIVHFVPTSGGPPPQYIIFGRVELLPNIYCLLHSTLHLWICCWPLAWREFWIISSHVWCLFHTALQYLYNHCTALRQWVCWPPSCLGSLVGQSTKSSPRSGKTKIIIFRLQFFGFRSGYQNRFGQRASIEQGTSKVLVRQIPYMVTLDKRNSETIPQNVWNKHETKREAEFENLKRSQNEAGFIALI